MVQYLPDLIVVWAVFMGLFLALLAYNATITRYEDNQVFLDDVNAYEEQQQNQIVRKINKTMPYVRLLGIVSGILTVIIIAIYTWDCWQKLQAQ
jgi:predicted membrane-bound spermidine synthase